MTAADFLEKLETAVAERSVERMTAMEYAEKLIADKERDKTVFDNSQRNLIVNFAYKLDDRAATEDLANNLAAAVAAENTEEINRLMWEAEEKIENLPDGMIGLSEMHEYGYLKDDVLPLTKEGAREWHRLGERIYPLFQDGTAGDFASQEEIEQHDGIFGIKADAWSAILLEKNEEYLEDEYGTVKETHYGVFICKRKKNTTPCAYHAVPEKMLMMVAMDQIHHLVSTMCEEEKLVKDMMRGSNLDSARSIKMKENSILFRIQEAEERRLRLYEDYKAEILDEDEYSQLKEHYIAEKQRLEHELQKQRQRALELEKRIKICDAQMERMRGILNQNEFDEELVHELIKRIYVGMDNSVEVEFKCSDPYQEVLAIMSEVQNE